MAENSKSARQRIHEKTLKLEMIRERVQAYVDRGGDLKSPEAAPMGMELLEAADDLAQEFGHKLLKPIKEKK